LFDASSRLKMQDQMPGVKNAGPENQHRKMEDQRLEADYLISLPGICEIISFIHVLCSGNLRDCVVVKQSVSTQCNTLSNTLKAVTVEEYAS